MRSAPGTPSSRASAATLPSYWLAPVRHLANSNQATGSGVPALPAVVGTAGAIDVSHRFGARLRTLRCERNLTQQDMARRFGIDRSFISDVERGRKSISLVTLEILALGLGVSISELLSDV